MTTNESLSLLACQISIPEITTVAERDTHLANTCEKVANAMAGEQVDLVVLPELSSIEYSRSTFKCLDALPSRWMGRRFSVGGGLPWSTDVMCHTALRVKRAVNFI